MGIRDPWRQGPQSPLFLPHEWVGGNDMWMHDVSSVGSVSGNIAEIPGICVTWQWHGMTPAWPPRRGQSDSALSCHGGRQNDKLWIHAPSTPFAESLLYRMKKKKEKECGCVCVFHSHASVWLQPANDVQIYHSRRQLWFHFHNTTANSAGRTSHQKHNIV